MLCRSFHMFGRGWKSSSHVKASEGGANAWTGGDCEISKLPTHQELNDMYACLDTRSKKWRQQKKWRMHLEGRYNMGPFESGSAYLVPWPSCLWGDPVWKWPFARTLAQSAEGVGRTMRGLARLINTTATKATVSSVSHIIAVAHLQRKPNGDGKENNGEDAWDYHQDPATGSQRAGPLSCKAREQNAFECEE